jgi:hypothetical protein
MELASASVAAQTRYTASGSFTVTAGNNLEVKGDSNELEEAVPGGKVWTVHISLSVIETDA